MLAAPAFSAIPLSPSAIARRPSMNAADHRHMARALTLAARGLYSADPNPRVGCVLVRDGEVVGEGWHGRTGLANGASQWITGEAARRDVQRWRARSAAIMTGIDTVLADDPLLNVRLPAAEWAQHGSGAVRQPLRVVLDSRLRLPTT